MAGFSVLLSVYYKENPKYLEEALASIYDKQSMKPNQIVLVQDGPLTTELEKVISFWKEKLDNLLVLVPLEKNVGLAAALNEGLKYCNNELVARMDTDDIASPDRFKKQISFMKSNPDVAVSSGLVEEWSEDFSHKVSERKLPLVHEDIYRFAKSRSPISHPAVVFRKTAVLESGGYPSFYPEDHPLWGLMLHKGYKFANLPDVLVKMRVGDAFIERRGKGFLKGEIELSKYLNEIGFINKYELFGNIVKRTLVRLAPVFVKRILYKHIR